MPPSADHFHQEEKKGGNFCRILVYIKHFPVKSMDTTRTSRVLWSCLIVTACSSTVFIMFTVPVRWDYFINPQN